MWSPSSRTLSRLRLLWSCTTRFLTENWFFRVGTAARDDHHFGIVGRGNYAGASIRGEKRRFLDQNDGEDGADYEPGTVGHLLHSIALFAIAGIRVASAARRNCHRVRCLPDHLSYLHFYPGAVLSKSCAHCRPGW